MQRRLAAWLGVWLVGGACAQILTSNVDQHTRVLMPANLRTIQKGNKSASVQYQNVDIVRDENEDSLLRETEHGPVMGVRWRDDDTGILAFIDIPYGTFEKPFAAPINPTNWQDPLYHTSHTKLCPQLQPPDDEPVLVGDADCLTLSVFTPVNAKDLPVLFYIYDSNFVSDSADPAVYGPENLVPKDVILVLPNYRLGPLGFLCLQNKTAPGNAALKDLALALKWTEKNIKEFGGNSSKIVVGGDGTAGALAQYLALSPMSREYIKGVITESGSVLAHWAIDRDPIATATILVNATGTLITDNIDIKEIISISHGIDFKPCVENGSDSFMNESSWETLNREETFNKFKDIVFMIGSADHAGMQEAAFQNLLHINYDFTKFLPNDLKFKNEDEKKEESDKIRDIYFKGPIENNKNVSLYHTDASYLGPSIRTARLLAKAGATVYFYEFSYVGELNRAKNSLLEHIDLDGAARGDIVGYTFTEEDPTISPEDDRMIDFMTTLWTSFAKEGKPLIADIEWNIFNMAKEDSEVWLSISKEPKVNSSGMYVDRLRLWTELYKNHFIDNRALGLNPCQFLMFLLSLVLLTFKMS